jgi:hypothetical protein
MSEGIFDDFHAGPNDPCQMRGTAVMWGVGDQDRKEYLPGCDLRALIDSGKPHADPTYELCVAYDLWPSIPGQGSMAYVVALCTDCARRAERVVRDGTIRFFGRRISEAVVRDLTLV